MNKARPPTLGRDRGRATARSAKAEPGPEPRPVLRPAVSLARALSKLGLASRKDAEVLVAAGRVRIDGRVVTNPALRVVPEKIRIDIDGRTARASRAFRFIAFHKPRGVVTTRRDPEGRRTVFDVLGEAADGLIAVGRLDLASTGLLLLTNDTQLANRLTDPRHAVLRRYVVTVRGQMTPESAAQLENGINGLRAARVEIRKSSARETHLVMDLTEGKNREVRRLCDGVGHEVTHLHRVAFGDVELGDLAPGEWRDLSASRAREQRAHG